MKTISLIPDCDDLFVVNSPEGGITFSDEIKEVKSSQLENILDTVSGVTSPKVSGSALLALVVILMPLLTTLDYSVCSCSYNFSII